jgi:hypothetical protein
MIDYAKLGIAIVLLLGAFGTGWALRNRDFNDYKREVDHAVKAQEAHVESIKKQQQITTTSIQKEYDAKLALLRQYYANGVRQPSASKLPTISSTTSGIDPIAAYSILIGQCAETTQQLASLIEWTKLQSELK